MRIPVTLVLALASCSDEPEHAAPTEAPAGGQVAARVANAVPEGALAVVMLDEQAERRLAIEVAPIVRRSVPSVLRRGARVVVPPGASLSVHAPLAGTLTLAAGAPRVGEHTRSGTPMFVLAPIFSPEARATLASQAAEARGDEGLAQADLTAAREAVARAEALLAERAGSQRAVEEARAVLAGVEARLAAARARQEVLEGSAVGELETIEIDAPIDGILRAMHVASGQMVSSGALLFEVLDASRLWVRVPVHVGEAGEVCAELPARAEGLELQPIAAPPTADPLGVTLDLYYAVDNSSGRLIPDQSLLVELTLKTPAEEDTVPSSALVRDTSGGTWIYARTGPGRYERRRVIVDRTVDDLAVLSRGPEPGTEAVIAGAAELFGTEFFVSK